MSDRFPAPAGSSSLGCNRIKADLANEVATLVALCKAEVLHRNTR
jgi:hypothetical protein